MSLKPVWIAVFSMFMMGCATSEDTISISYRSAATASTVAGAEDVSLAISAIDGRTTNRTVVSRKINGYGMEMAAIRSNQDITGVVRNALRAEFVRRGFTVGEGGMPLVATITKFYNQYASGFFSGTSTADIAINISVANGDETIFEKSYTGTQENDVMIAGGENAKAALDAALTKIVSKIMVDKELMDFLLQERANQISTPVAEVTS